MSASGIIGPLRRAHASGWTHRELANLYRIDPVEVRRLLAGPGPSDRARSIVARRRARGRRDEAIRALRASGWSVAALADRFRLSESTISGLASGLGPRRDLDPPDPPRDDGAARPPAEAGPAPIEAVGPPPPGPDPGPWDDRTARGSKHGRAKLDEADAAELRRLWSEGWTYLALAERFGVGRSTVYGVISGRVWAHVPMPG